METIIAHPISLDNENSYTALIQRKETETLLAVVRGPRPIADKLKQPLQPFSAPLEKTLMLEHLSWAAGRPALNAGMRCCGRTQSGAKADGCKL